MTIQTKFDNEQTVYFLSNGKIYVGKVSRIRTDSFPSSTVVEYVVRFLNESNRQTDSTMSEYYLFGSTDDLVKKLLDDIVGENKTV
jgi:hypothetical protein